MFNNSTNSSDDFRRELNRYISTVNNHILYIQLFVCVIGVLGNLLALIIINQKSLRNTSSAVFITYMAIFDSAVLLTQFMDLIEPIRNVFPPCVLTYFIDLSTLCANWILVIITLERCVAVYSPLLAKRVCTIDSARYSIYLLLTISVIFLSGSFAIFYYIDHTKINSKCSVHKKYSLPLRIYELTLFYGIPDIFLLSNLFTIYALFLRRKRLSLAYENQDEKLDMRINDVNSNRKQRQLTIMLVTVSLSFYLFTTPAMIFFIAEHSPPKHRELDKIKKRFLFSQISVLLLQLNDATNFIFYCFAGQRFRYTAMQTFCYYLASLKIFYHRYILCDQEYDLISIQQYSANSMRKATYLGRGSLTPNRHDERRYRTSKI